MHDIQYIETHYVTETTGKRTGKNSHTEVQQIVSVGFIVQHSERKGTFRPVVLNLFHCWDPLNATDVVRDPQVKSDLKLETDSKCGE